MRALVTGSAGFLGRRFHAALIARGYEVATCDVKSPGMFSDCRHLFDAITPHYDLVVHCAAVVGGRDTREDTPLAIADNLALDAALFRWAVRTKPSRVLYMSSSAAYPAEVQREPGWRLRESDIDLDDPVEPDALYGWIKLTGERLAALAREQGVAVTVVRPQSGYGEDQDACYPFGAFRDRARRRADPFEIWGNADVVRDFIYADDVVGAALTAVHVGFDGPLNIGSGVPTSMGELAEAFCRQAGYAPAFKVLEDRPSGTFWRCCDTSLLSTLYTPTVSLTEGIIRALA